MQKINIIVLSTWKLICFSFIYVEIWFSVGVLCDKACSTKGCSSSPSGYLPRLEARGTIHSSRHQSNSCHQGIFYIFYFQVQNTITI